MVFSIKISSPTREEHVHLHTITPPHPYLTVCSFDGNVVFFYLIQYSIFTKLKLIHHIKKYSICFRLKAVSCPRMLFLHIVNNKFRWFFLLIFFSFCNSRFISSRFWAFFELLKLGSISVLDSFLHCSSYFRGFFSRL